MLRVIGWVEEVMQKKWFCWHFGSWLCLNVRRLKWFTWRRNAATRCVQVHREKIHINLLVHLSATSCSFSYKESLIRLIGCIVCLSGWFIFYFLLDIKYKAVQMFTSLWIRFKQTHFQERQVCSVCLWTSIHLQRSPFIRDHPGVIKCASSGRLHLSWTNEFIWKRTPPSPLNECGCLMSLPERKPSSVSAG